jgi:hypothetical protein
LPLQTVAQSGAVVPPLQLVPQLRDLEAVNLAISCSLRLPVATFAGNQLQRGLADLVVAVVEPTQQPPKL